MSKFRLIALSLLASTLAACGGGGSDSSASSSSESPPPSPPAVSSQPPTLPAASVTISGQLTYDRVPHNDNSGLDYANIIALPIRGAVVEAINLSGETLATTNSDLNGRYELTLDSNLEVRIQVNAQLLPADQLSLTETKSWDFTVTDNTQGNQLYALQGSMVSTGNRNAQTRNLHAPHGWTGQSYGEVRAAAPFAILDNVFSAVQAFRAVDENIIFPPLELRWSPRNRTTLGQRSSGNIGHSAYFPDVDGGTIYILGEDGRDTDEYDQHVIIHEWGHYFEHQISRSDSIGGLHSLNDRLDPRVAFSEGWSNALSAIITGDPVYRDSSGEGQQFGFSFDLAEENIFRPGWFSEAAVGSILYDIFKTGNLTSEGLAPIYDVMTSETYKDMPVFTTIFALADGLRENGQIAPETISTILENHSISGEGPNGSGELNSGAIQSALPIYKEISLNDLTAEFCSVDDAGVFNKLGNREFIFLKLETDSDITLSAQKISGDADRDPDFNIWRGNELVEQSFSSADNEEVFIGRLEAGEYVIEAFDLFNTNGSGARRGDACFDLRVTG